MNHPSPPSSDLARIPARAGPRAAWPASIARGAVLGVIALLATSCCNGIGLAGVTLTIHDPAGACPEDLHASYSIDNDPQSPLVCKAALDQAGTCSCQTALDGGAGTYSISVESQDGKRSASGEASVHADDCDLITQAVVLTLN